jgi:phosphatidylinositol alpha-1,6-mannosyltransferase
VARTLLITNDFPPRPGGIQIFVHKLAVRQPEDALVVYASTWRGDTTFDAEQPFEVVRDRTSVLLPTPRVARRAADLARAHDCDTVWFGAAAPLGLLAAGLKRNGIQRAVAQTHGHEVGWAKLPGARQMLGNIGKHVDVSTYLSEYQRVRLAPLLRNLERLTPGVDTDTFNPGVDGAQIRKKYDLFDRPTIVCVSRLVPRKGQDMLIRALPTVKKKVPDAKLLIVSGGPDRDRLAKLAKGQEDDVIFTGSVPWESLPEHYAAGDVYAMPCRTRRQGLDVEGLGIVYLEASATGLPVVAGNSGGAPDAVLENETGYVVDGRDVPTIADRLVTLLKDRDLARKMGAAGRAWVEKEWRWDTQGHRLTTLLHPH